MSETPEHIIDIVCRVLKLDVDQMAIEKKQGNQRYRDGRLMATYLMRQRIIETKVVYSTRADGVRAYMEADKPITYGQIAYTFKRKNPQSAMASELKCKDLLKTDKDFKAKYDMVVNLLNGNLNIA